MAIILYINNVHCTSVNQLKEYFPDDLTPESDIYADLLDYGRHGDIAKWLREMDEPELATKLESIAPDLSDSAFYARMKATITGSPIKPDPRLRPTFEKCFSFEGIKCDIMDNEVRVTVNLKVLMCVNEDYELSVSSNWGTRAEWINPYNYPEGKTASFTFTLRKRPGKDIGEIKAKADDIVLSLGKNANNNTSTDVFTVKGVKFKMIRVEGGRFLMGEGNDRHEVELNSFSIGETVVTQELWQIVMGNNPSISKRGCLPVENVSWVDCQEFLRKLNRETRCQFRLPSEAEWEFAARGGNKEKDKKYIYSGGNCIDDLAWCLFNSGGHTHPVIGEEKTPNGLGIYGMSGNVWEWCQDRRGDEYVYRGGSWNCSTEFCRVSYRSQDSSHHRSFDLGLRLAL